MANKRRWSDFDPELLASMAAHVKIPSKEPGDDGELDDEQGGVLKPFQPFFPTQTYVMSEIEKGKAAGANTFYVLKCRQSGLTHLGLLITLQWCFKFSGMIYCFIADNSSRLFRNRKLCKQFVRSLKEVPEWRQEVDEDNRYVLSFKNDSELYWLNANSDDEGGLGASIGAVASWGTEIGRYKDVQGFLNFLSSISENNPIALNVFEGTSQGPNLFKELYEIAAEPGSTSQRAIFVGWWLHPWYEHKLSNPVHAQRYKVYWETCPRLTRDEARWVEGVKLRYGFDVRPTQVSWWRWHLYEKKKKNLLLMYQEYPPLPEDAWTFGGESFVDGRKLSTMTSRAQLARNDPRRYFVFDPGDEVKFETSKLVEVDPLSAGWWDLVCYSEPIIGPRVRYCIGHDPAHGANEESDHCCAQVFLCYSDKAIQMAEFVKRQIPTYQQAWVLLHLVGIYNTDEAPTLLNIEQQGGGDTILEEFRRMENEAAWGYSDKILAYFQRLEHYIYTRVDSMNQRSTTLHWETTMRTKSRMLHTLKGLIERDMLEIRSEQAISEVLSMNQLRTGEIESAAENHRLMALAVASMAYIQIVEKHMAGAEEEFLSTKLKHVQGKEPQALKPDEVLNAAFDRWRHEVLVESAEEVSDHGEAPQWMYQEDVAEYDYDL